MYISQFEGIANSKEVTKHTIIDDNRGYGSVIFYYWMNMGTTLGRNSPYYKYLKIYPYDRHVCIRDLHKP